MFFSETRCIYYINSLSFFTLLFFHFIFIVKLRFVNFYTNKRIWMNKAVMICTTLVNTQTHTDSFWPVILLVQPAELKTTCSSGILARKHVANIFARTLNSCANNSWRWYVRASLWRMLLKMTFSSSNAQAELTLDSIEVCGNNNCCSHSFPFPRNNSHSHPIPISSPLPHFHSHFSRHLYSHCFPFPYSHCQQ